MAVQNQFIDVANSSTDSASTWIYLADWILVLIVGFAFVFYFDRLIGFTISFIGKWLWRSSNVGINIESIRFSVLGGRVLIKNLTIMNEDWTISVLQLNFTWRYWLWGKTRIPEFVLPDENDGNESSFTKSDNEKLPSRFLLAMEGLEIFMYNRTMAYDNIVETLTKEKLNKEKSPDTSSSSHLRYRSRDTTNDNDNDNDNDKEQISPSSSEDDLSVDKLYKTLKRLMKMLPLSVLIKKGVMVLGNKDTPSLLVSSCKSANGILDITKPAHKADIYKQLNFFEFQEFQVSMKPNILYSPDSRTRFKSIKKLFSRSQEPVIDQAKWQGLRRYLESNDDVLDNLPNAEEYAKSSLILDTVWTKINYYFDIPGKIVDGTFPDYGADVEFSMATIHYGPWADKQRVPIQSVFFPAIARDSEPTDLTKRQYKGFKLNVFTNDEIILRIPTRETSKDKDALKHHTQPQNKRPFGWLELKSGPNSSITSYNSFVCSRDKGWENTISAVFLQLEMRSSVNHDILYSADVHTINAQVGFPLTWNGACDWIFDNFSSNSKLFFLREHSILLSDVFEDFASGPPALYENFRPFKYHFNWEFSDYKIYLNINDSNIINNPLDFNSNKYISFQGPELKIKLLIPLLGQFTNKNTVDYYIFAPYFDLVLDTPPWHTCNAFLSPSYILGRAHNFEMDGSYTYFNKIEAYGFNNIVINCKCDEVSLKFYGFLVKYVFVLRENYLGDNFHFKTFEEYNNEMDNNSSEATLQDDLDYWKIIKTDNSVDVIFTFQVRKGLLVLPQDIYGCKAHIGLVFDYFDTDLRFTNYYMDMQADFSPVKGKYLRLDNEDIILELKDYYKLMEDDPHITMDEFTVHGHRMFGIPPEEITYFCNWRAATNEINVDAPLQFTDVFGDCIGNFLNSFSDLANALHPTAPVIYDALVFTFDCPDLNIKLNTQSRYQHTKLHQLLLTYNDIANSRYSNKLSINIQDIQHEFVDKTTGNILGLIKTSLTLDNPTRKPNFKEHRKSQQEHIRFNDAPFHRAPFLLSETNRNLAYNEGFGSFIIPISLIDVNYPLNDRTQLEDPYSSSLSSSTASSFSDDTPAEDGDLFISPTLHYVEEDFQPDSQADGVFKHDNMIFTFSEVNGFLSPEAVHTMALFQYEGLETDLHVVIDSLEQSVVKALKKLMLQTCMNDTFRVVAPSINLSFGECYSPTYDLKYFSDNSFINLQINEPSIAFADEVKRTLDPDCDSHNANDYSIESAKSYAFSIKNIHVSFQNSCDFSIQDIEFWMTEDKFQIFSASVEDIILNLDETKILQLINYFDELLKVLKPAIDLFQKTSAIKRKLTMALVYGLSSVSSSVNHDPCVLTKPAYMIRSLKQHIRFFDTWVVMMRLRHIFETMDSDWKLSQRQRFRDNLWDIPEDAYDQVWETFSNWRSWEANYEDRETFFQTMFNIDILQEKKMIGQTILKNVSINWSKDDFFFYENITLSLNERKYEANFSRTDHDLDDLDANVSSFEVSINLGNYSGSVSPVSIKLIPSIVSYFESRPGDPVVQAIKPKNSAFFYMVNLNDFNQKLRLNYSNIEISATSLRSSGLVQSIEGQDLCSVTTDIEMLGFNLQDTLSFGIQNFKSVLGHGSSSYFYDLFLDNCFFELVDHKFSTTIDKIMTEDLPMFDFLTKKEPTPSTKTDPLDMLHKLLALNVSLTLQINHLNWKVNILKHYNFEGKVYDNNFSVAIANKEMDIGSLIQQVDFIINHQKSLVLEIKNSQLFNNAKIISTGQGLPTVSVDSQLGYTKFFSSKLVKSINQVLDDYQELKIEVQNIIDKFPKQENKPHQTSIDITKMPIDITILNHYFGVSWINDRSKYSIESEDFKFSISNYDEVMKLVDYFGEISIPTARLSISDRIIPAKLSNFVDMNLSMKLLNETKGKLLEVSSEYFRICLSSGVIQRLVHFADEITRISNRLKMDFPSINTGGESGDLSDTSSFVDQISAIHFLSYNFCIGWIFDNPRKDYPGLIMGAERFYAVTDEGIGKLSLIEAYLSVAHGTTANSFYSSTGERDGPNRAFLPFMQTIYIIHENETNGKEMKISITGDELDVKFLSDSFQIFESTMNSVSSMQAHFDKRVRPMDKWKDSSEKHEEQQYIESLRSTFQSIECKVTFAGSTVLIHRLTEHNKPASLYLHFPAVQTFINYAHDKIGPKKHNFKAEISTASSENKLYSSCVPVIVDLINTIKGIMKSQSDSPPLIDNVDTDVVKDKKDQAFNFASFLDETDFYLGLHIDKQILSFSCEPTAKVESVVGIEGLTFQLMSGENSSINITGNLNSVSISLQHIYSREVSGYFKINSILSVSKISFDKQVEVKSSGSIGDVDGYINVKQYQDLELFRDIWFPKQLYEAKEPEQEEKIADSLAANKNIALRFKEVSTTNALPWLLTYILLNLTIKVNFGPSLGEMIFRIDRFWMMSKKSTDWTQQLKFGISSFVLTSEGRLGGKIIGNELYLNSAISWKINNETLDVPLVLMSTGIEKLQIKSTFDYHLFLVSNLEEFSLDVFNQKSESMISKDHLFVTTKFKIFEIYMSSFTASNVYDIYNAILRMTQENKISYKETLHDAKTQRNKKPSMQSLNNLSEKIQNNAILETVKKLETEFEVVMGTLMVYVYPSSFDDSKVLVLKLDRSTAFFSQNEYNEGIANQLEIQFNDLVVSLSINSNISEDFITNCTVEEFVKYAHKARGGNIFVFPSFAISMKTFQKYNSNLIEYLYNSTFGRTVDIRWNLGSVNFIREMYSIHLKSLESRTEFKKTIQNRDDFEGIKFKQDIFTHHEHDSDSDIDPITKDPSEEIDQVINEKIDKVSKESKYDYLPLAPPIIEAPRLKELGNATPPLEWFGLHRNKFPNVTHELGIVNLQKIIHEVESEYSKLLGRA
ncbi:hypothetical protein CLIB1444_02S15082 [[Candida] jaroonii]|uniref:Uncharacterized protein n=1 Tax=[Candida] jaroonii TaxID=467808 RepID=A0ACA9Y434_9ASCO|nr:hypothetical protein CLIB1444_02S15082 [[Candida] jaroonii]